jgi:iron-sulfur cluster assembly protein
MTATIDTTSVQPKALLKATSDAIAALHEMMNGEEGKDKQGVRLGVKGGGCSGFSYVLEFDNPREGDNTLEQDGIKFFMDRKSAIYLKGIVLDYKAGLKGKGFAFQNPNASSTCGCGESFSV